MQHKRKYKGHDRTTADLHSIPRRLLFKYEDNSGNEAVESSVSYSILRIFALLLVIIVNYLANDTSCFAIEATASLSLSNSELKSVVVTAGDIATASTNVTVEAANIDTYSLILSVDRANITSNGTTLTAGDVTTGNTWGYKWDAASTYTAPSVSGTNLLVPAPINNAVSFTKTLTFGAKFGDSANAGTYHANGTLSLVATPKSVVFTVTYDANGGVNAPSSQNCEVAEGKTSCTITPPKTGPSKTGYTFLGWAETNNATETTSNLRYSISLSQNKTVYAVWKKHLATTSGFTSITNLQQMTSSICNSAAIGATKKLTDSRDSKQYSVTKLEDGRCWMTENLRLVGSRTLTSSNSNVTSDWTIPASNASSFVSDDASQAVYYDSGGTGQAYYSWCAATAGTCANPDTNENATSSICPKGWRLPTGEDGGEFKTLVSAILGTTDGSYDNIKFLEGEPYNFKQDGSMFPKYTAPSNVGSEGIWWTRQKLVSTMAWRFRLNTSSFTFPHVGNGAGMKYGYFVRCIAE